MSKPTPMKGNRMIVKKQFALGLAAGIIAALVVGFAADQAHATDPEPVEITAPQVTFREPTCDLLEGYPEFPADLPDWLSYGIDVDELNSDDIPTAVTVTAHIQEDYDDTERVLVGQTVWVHRYTFPDCDQKPAEDDDMATGEALPDLPDTGPVRTALAVTGVILILVGLGVLRATHITRR